jgi:hypothetical protein
VAMSHFAREERMSDLHASGRELNLTVLFTPYRLVTMGVRIAVGRYAHAMMFPSQFTWPKENPKSRTTYRPVRNVLGKHRELNTVPLLDMGPNQGQLAEPTTSRANCP